MPACPACGANIPETADTCPACSAATPWAADVTHLAAGPFHSAAPTRADARIRSASSGAVTTSRSLTSADAIDHGRFAPGALLAGRYRIVGRLGKGGMGEVYRADDLKLSQPVALKFLPDSIDQDPARLTQLHTEVRMARQVAHPNVCAVYDIGDYEGHVFLSMEYVDGEDLASLLRRIGRMPEDRGIEMARQICAGLAAAHDRGVVHRDLKPANIMLDGSGRIRITDFGLAGVAGEVLRAGTPAYMAPEQLAGGEVTPRSDIYALGLVLYEIFTGQRALDARTMAELIAKREQAEITPPTTIVRDLDEAIERAILRCLEPAPERRPASALAVAAALPGGDPLAAALAAGQTPSPEMVAAAGTAGRVAVSIAVGTAAWIAIGCAVVLVLYQRVLMINIAPLPKPPEVLADRAQEIISRLGYGENIRATASGFGTSLDWANYIAATTTTRDRWNQLRLARPETHIFWSRTSPRTRRPIGDTNPIEGTTPPLNIAGMALAVVDSSGRLSEFVAVPAPTPPSNETARTMDWRVLFESAGLPLNAFTPVEPHWRPSVYAEERKAWEGPLPDRPDLRVRVEAAATAGRAVFFTINGPWSRSMRTAVPPPQPLLTRITSAITALVMPGLMIVAAVLARRNVKAGRGDRRGALAAASAVFVFLIGAWLLGNNRVGPLSIEIDRVFAAIGMALFNAAVVWLSYLGVEPYVRRFSADALIGWSRLIAGNWRDARVGRDIMIGVAVGIAMTVVYAVHNLLPLLAGRPEPMPATPDPTVLLSVRYAMAKVLTQMQDALTSAMLGLGGFVALRIWLKRRWLAAVAAVICYTGVVMNGMFSPGSPILDLALGATITAAFVGVLGWAGLLTAVATLATHFILLRAPLTTDFSSWRAGPGLVFLGVVLVFGLGGCYLASRAPGDLSHGA